MSRKKRDKSLMDKLFEGSLFDEVDGLLKKYEGEEMSGQYSISVTETPEGTKVRAKVGKDTDLNEFRKRLQRQYPGAQIEIEGGKPLIREISTKSVDDEKERRDRKGQTPRMKTKA